jgi:DNA-directed RNA polymerase subunit RPC12/RpoP
MSVYFKFACIYCGQHIECDDNLSGRQTKCPGCQNRIVVPRPANGQVAIAPPPRFTWDTVVPVPETNPCEKRKQ